MMKFIVEFIQGRKLTVEITRKLTEIERLMVSLEGGCWKSAFEQLAGSLPYYPMSQEKMPCMIFILYKVISLTIIQ
jgi:hypothetical protein